MQFFTLTFLVAALSAVSEACKCVRGGANYDHTLQCCNQLRGSFSNGDCAAGSISNKLSNFRNCCKSFGDTSDCDCPKGCSAVQKRDVEKMMEIQTADSIMTII